MSIIDVKQIGGFTKIEKFFEKMQKNHLAKKANEFAMMGTEALMAATPVDTGLTASSWGHEVEVSDSTTTITWVNHNTNKNVNIAYIVDQGHGTGTGGYVPGRNFIKPALEPVMDTIADENWKEVTSS